MKFQSRNSEVTVNVEKVLPDGSVQAKALKFDCSVKHYGFIRTVSASARKIEEITKRQNKDLYSVDELFVVERDAFEAMAPGRWDEFLEFLDRDAEYMAQLIAEMIAAVRAAGIAAKAEAVAPAGPDAQ